MKNNFLIAFLLLGANYIGAQVTVEFRISSVSSDIGDMDPVGDSDPRWSFSITDVPFSSTQSSSHQLINTNCPGAVAITNTFYSQVYNCSPPSQFDFTWSGDETDGAGFGGAPTTNTGPQVVNIPIGALVFPQAAFTTIGTYSATSVGMVGCPGVAGNITWNITLQYRTVGTLPPDQTIPTISCPLDQNVSFSSSCDYSLLDYTGLAVVTDNCAPLLVSQSVPAGTLITSNQLVTLTVTDPTGNSVNCAFNILPTDTQVPAVTCSGAVNTTASAGLCTGNAVVPGPTVATDNCGVSTILNSFNGTASANGTYPVGTTVVTWTVTDVNGNTNTCLQNVTVTDTQAPAVTCSGAVNLTASAGLCTGNAVVPGPTVATDNCGVSTILNSFNGTASANGTYPVGTTVVTWTVTDVNGNTNTCLQNVTVTDTEDPIVTCSGAVNTTASAGLCTGNAVVPGPTVATDNCGVFSILNDYNGTTSANDIYPVGTTPVTWEVTDVNGNTNTCLQNVTVTDTQAPAVTCSGAVNTTASAGLCTGNAVVPGPTVATDNCGVSTILNSFNGTASANGTYPVGTTVVTWTVTDVNGNTNTCLQTVTVSDTQAPAVTCSGAVNLTASAGLCTGNAVVPGPTVATDNCGVSTILNSFNGTASANDTYPVGTTVVTWTVTDVNGNTNTCLQNVTVTDTELPTITCNAPITVSNDAGVCGATITYTNTSTDNCPGQVITQTAGLPSGSVFPIGTTTNTFVVTDASGNTATCSFNVTVNDTELPTITCNAPITVSNDAGVCGATITYTNTSTDNCPGQVITQTAGLPSGSVFPIGTTTNTFVVTDASGNTATCSFNVTVNDIQNPQITCPANITQDNDLGLCGATVIYGTPIGTDNCPGSITNLTSGQASGTVFPIGTTVVTYTVTDASMNTGTCNFNVTINDTQLPTVACQPNIIQNNDLGVCGAVVTYVTPLGADNCPGSVTILTAGQVSGTVFPIGTTTVTYLVTDAPGNTGTCSFDVTVDDIQNPTIVCPGNITQNNDLGICGATINYLTPIGVDNCPGSITALTAGLGSGALFPIGVTSVSYLVTDPSLNTASCNFNVTVNDTENPTIVCPANIIQSNDAGICGAVVNYITPVGLDNCSGSITTLTAGQPSGSIFPVGTTALSYQVIDMSGNVGSCNFSITINDNENPTIVCPSNIIQSNDISVCGAIINYTTPIGFDNCAGPITTITAGLPSGSLFPIGLTTVTYLVTDLLGNTGTCSFSVVVNDNEAPTIVCPSDITTSTDPALCGASVIYPIPVGVDNCPGSVTAMTSGLVPGSVFPVGTTTSTYTVTDLSANVAMCSFDVTIIDFEAPTLTCPPDQNVSFDSNCLYSLLDYLPLATTGDNCSVASFTQSLSPGTNISTTTSILISSVDLAGNLTTCSFNIIPTDNTNPVITCPPNQNVYNDNFCQFTLNDYTGIVVTSDNCGVASIIQSPLPGSVLSSTTNVSVSVFDVAGNMTSCNFDVISIDTITPIINCPVFPVNVFFDANCEFIVPDYTTMPSIIENCAVGVVMQSPAIGTVITGNQLITVDVIDVAGNSNTCSFMVIPLDTIAPVISCPPNQIQTLNDTCYSVLQNYTALANTTANCEAVLVTQSPAPGLVFNTTQTMLLFGTDASGNSSFCFFILTLIDTINPVITCGPDIITCNNNVNYPQPTATDNCSVNSITRIAGPAPGSVFPDGLTVITYVAEDDFGNTDTCSFNVFVNTTPVPTAVVTDVSCNGFGDGMIDVSISLGVAPYTYLWDYGGAVTEDLTGLSGGDYTIIVTDSKGCMDTLTVTVLEPEVLTASATAANISCYNANDGSIDLYPTGGSPAYNYAWTPTQAGSSIGNLAAGNYDVIISDANGCLFDTTFNITNPDSISISGVISQYPNSWQISCEGCYDGWIDVTSSGGVGNLTYEWTNGSLSEDISDIPAGSYTIVVTDQNGCINDMTFILDQPLAVVMSNAFSPNGDGLNDYFQILNIDRYPNNTLTVMNRWGDVVYKAAPYKNDWYGEPNTGLILYGNEVPEGSYYFVLDINDGNPIKGYIVINR